MKDLDKNLKVALVQASPVMFNKDATIDKVCGQILEAGKNGTELIVFPESIIPCYPYGLTYGFTVGSRTEACRDDWKIYYDNSVLCPSADTDKIGAVAKEAHAYAKLWVSGMSAIGAVLLFGAAFASATVGLPITIAIGVVGAVANIILWLFPVEPQIIAKTKDSFPAVESSYF